MTLIHFFDSGSVERGRPYYCHRTRRWVPNYKLFNGWAEVTEKGHLAPSLTKQEAQADARNRGGKAVFHDTEEAARAALLGQAVAIG